jgi:ATP-binding cassette, subfamily B, bacterial
MSEPSGSPRRSGDLALFRRLLREARPYRSHLVALLAVSLLATPIALLTPVPLTIVIDQLAGAGGVPGVLDAALPGTMTATDTGVIIVAVSLLIVVAILRQLQQLMVSLLQTYTGEKLVMGFRTRLFGHAQRLSLGYHDTTGTADSVYRIQYDTLAIRSIAVDGLIPFVSSIVTLVGMIVVTAALDVQLALVALAVSPPLLVITHAYRRRLRRRHKEVKRLESAAMSVVQEVLAALRVVKSFGQEEREEDRFRRRSVQGVRARLGVAITDGAFALLVGLTIALGMGAVLYVGFRSVRAGTLSEGELVLIAGYMTQLYEPLRTLSKRAGSLQSAFASAERAYSLLDHARDVSERPDAKPIDRARGAVDFRTVCFSYETREQVLQDLSFSVEPGMRVGVCGATGVGKSTLLSLLPRLYDPTSGQILLDGTDVRGYRLKDLRDQFAIVLQDTVLFPTSIAENIAYARPGASFEDVVSAAEAANAHEFISAFPDGYETLVGERGMRLSGGERQRISLARAFLKDAPILLLDEPTTGLDVESSGLVLEALRTLMRGRTTLIISHDFRLIRWADQILVLRDGRIEEAGAHQALLEGGGVYASLYAKQFDFDGAVRVDPRTADANGQRSGRKSLEAVGAASEGRAANDGAAAQAASADVATDELSVDARQSRVLLRELPEVATAFDEDAMRERLERALLYSGYVVERCTLDKALYLPAEGCLVRYELEIADGVGSSGRYLVGGQLFPDQPQCVEFLSTRLVPLARLAEGRPELAPFANPVTALDPLPMAVYAFPIDPDLPTLVDATDPQRIVGLFRFDDQRSGGTVPADSCRVDLVDYPSRGRCVLRYDLAGTLRSGEEIRRSVYGRVTAEPPAGHPAAHQLRECSGRPFPDRFAVPRILGVRPNLGVTFVEAIAGVPLIARLVAPRAGVDEAPETELSLEDAVDTCADIAAALHAAGVDAGSCRTLEDELDALHSSISSVRRISPTLGAQLAERLERLRAGPASSRPLPPVLCHGDYAPGQVVFDRRASGLAHLDTLTWGEAALDLGNFSAHLRVICRNAERASSSPLSTPGSELSKRFVDSYIAAAGVSPEQAGSLLSRVRTYETASLLRMAVHTWLQLEPMRTADVLSVLEEQAPLPAGSVSTLDRPRTGLPTTVDSRQMKPRQQDAVIGVAAARSNGRDLLEADAPVLEAWRTMAPRRTPAVRVDVLKVPKRSAPSGVYRLLSRRGRALAVAKRSSAPGLAVERALLERVLPLLPVRTPRFLGYVELADEAWLFMKDVGDGRYTPDDLVLTTEWLAELHASGARLGDNVELPDRGPDHYRLHLEAARTTMVENRARRWLTDVDRALIDRAITMCGRIDACWNRLEDVCAQFPRTLVHGDFAAKNLRVRRRGRSTELFVLDWEMAGWSAPSADVAFLAGSPLLEHYCDVARAHGYEVDYEHAGDLAAVGVVFRWVAGLDWASRSLRYPWVDEALRKIEYYVPSLDTALSAVEAS